MLYICEKNLNLRQLWLDKITIPQNFNNLPNSEKFAVALDEPSNVKYTDQYLIDILDLRRLLNNLY